MSIKLISVVGLFLMTLALSSAYSFWTPPHVSKPYRARILRVGQQCTEEGFFRDSEDCQKFYRCALLPSAVGNKITRYEFRCPGGTVFDETIATCNYPQQMENPPTNCREEATQAPPPIQPPQVPGVPSQPGTNPQFPQVPGQGGSGSQPSQPGTNPQFPQIPPQGGSGSQPSQPSQPGTNPQLPQVPNQPQFPVIQQPSVPGGSTGSTEQPSQAQVPGFPSNPQQQQPQIPTFQPPNQQGSGNQQFPSGFPGQTQPQQPPPSQKFILRPTGQNLYYIPPYSHKQQQQPPITFGMY